MTVTPPLLHRSDLEQAVERAVAEHVPVSAWPETLRRAYAEHRHDAIRSEVRYQQIIGLCIIVMSILLDLVAVPGQVIQGAVLKLGLTVPVAVFAIAFAKRMKLTHLKLAVSYTMIVFAAIAVHLAAFADPATATRYTMATTLMLALGVILLPFEREELVAFAVAFCIAVLAAGLWPQALPILTMLEHAVMTPVVAGAALMIAWRHQDTAARNFLYDLRDRFTRAELEQNVRVLRELSESDSLTGLANRRSFRSSFDNRFTGEARAPGQSVTLMMIDLDHFKRFNDEFGHQAGDRALRSVGRCLEANFGEVDGIVARFGGEEFIAAFQSASVAEAERLADRVRRAVSALDIPVRDSQRQQVTTSIGLASTGPEAAIDLNELTARADRALYVAKRDGRDRVVVSERIELRVDRLMG